jgi:putative redox protein
MVEIQLTYEGDLHCSVTHGPSGDVISTDAPVDNNGRGQAFSPTDLVAGALGACMATVMGIAARNRGIALEGMTVTVRKIMASDPPRRIGRLEVALMVPLPPDHPDRALLESTANACPVKRSLDPAIDVAVTWQWVG